MGMTRDGSEPIPSTPVASGCRMRTLVHRERDHTTTGGIPPGTADEAGAAVDRHIRIAERLKINPASAPISDPAELMSAVEIIMER
jgi:hypothetical protein